MVSALRDRFGLLAERPPSGFGLLGFSSESLFWVSRAGAKTSHGGAGTAARVVAYV